MTGFERTVRVGAQLAAGLAGGACGFVLGIVGLILITAYSPYPGYEPAWAPDWLYAVPAMVGAGLSAWLTNRALGLIGRGAV